MGDKAIRVSFYDVDSCQAVEDFPNLGAAVARIEAWLHEDSDHWVAVE